MTTARLMLGLCIAASFVLSQTRVDYGTQVKNVPLGAGAPTLLAGPGIILIHNPSTGTLEISVNPASVGFLGSPNLWTGNNDASMASHTTPAKVGPQSAAPLGCVVGELYFATDRAPGFNLLACTSPGAWIPMR